MNEVLCHYSEKIKESKVTYDLNLWYKKYFVVSAHREENVDDPNQFRKLLNILRKLAECHLVIVSTHPRTRKILGDVNLNNVQFSKPLGFFDYVQLQLNAACTLSDSGSLFEEASLLNFPALSLRDTFERQESMEEGAVMLVGLDWTRVQEGLKILEGRHELIHVPDYSAPIVSEKIVRIIQSYTSYVNKVVWHAANN
jgi:UDP-N-acetylglucosamine 2-epimerase (non-hydrolysing)